MANNGKYVQITREMVELGLHGSRLIVYAIVYGYSQDGNSSFRASLKYVMFWTGLSKGQVCTILHDLTDEGFIRREDKDGVTYYSANVDRLENQTHSLENQTDRSENQTPSNNNINNNIYNTHTNNAHARKDDDIKWPFGEKVVMTNDEFAALAAKYGEDDTKRLIAILDDYLVNHPKRTYNSHYRAILSWCVNKLNEEKLTEQRLKNAEDAAHRINSNGAPALPANQPRTTYAEAMKRQAEIDAKYNK